MSGLMSALCCAGNKSSLKPVDERKTVNSAIAPTDRGTVASQAATARDPTMASKAASTRGPTMASQAASTRGPTVASKAASTRAPTMASQAPAESTRPFGTAGRGTPPALPAGLAAWEPDLQQRTAADCSAAGLAQLADGAFYAATPGEAGWTAIYADPHTEEIMQDDGETMKTTMIDEAFALKTVAETGSAPEGGLWLGGMKYRVTQSDLEYEQGEYAYHSILVNKPKGGARIVKTSSQIVVGFFDEAQGQSASACTVATMDVAEYLMGVGY